MRPERGVFMRCTNCKKRVPDAPYCQRCGYYMGVEIPKRKTKRRPNGAGTIVKIDRLRKPYRACYKGVYLGYFTTAIQAEQAIFEAKGNKDIDKLQYTLQDVYDAVTGTREWQRKSKSHKVNTQTMWNYMTELHSVRAVSVTNEMLQDVLYRAEDEGKSQSYQLKLRLLMRQLCLWCRQHGLHKMDYSEGLVVEGKVKGVRNAFEDKDLAILYEHREERVPAILWILCCTGWRFADLEKILRDERIDLQAHSILLEGSKTEAGRERYSVMDDITWGIFMRFYLATKPGDYIFKSPTGGRWNTHNFRAREFYPCLEKLGIQPAPQKGETPKYVPYSVRHTFATLSDRAGVDKETIQRAIGHVPGSSVTDDHYIHDHNQKAILEFKKLNIKIAEIVK